MIELGQALISYQDYHVFIPTLRVNPQVQMFLGATVRKILTVWPSQCSYGLAPRFGWTCGFTLSVA